jgi:hypothetical protein
MPGDYSRKTFNRKKHYSGVLMQQGRVQLDSDWNEQHDIQLYRTETEATDVIGKSGVPKKSDGFKIGVTPGGHDLTISPGRIYDDGLLCELDQPATYTTQPYFPNPDFTALVTSPPSSPPGDALQLILVDGTYLVFLDAWQREITALDDRLIREVALGGPDTAARLQNVYQIRLLSLLPTSPPGDVTCKTALAEFDQHTALSTGMLNARTQPPQEQENLCLLPPSAGYSRLENQLYRVEIHSGGSSSQAMVKWSRDNASVKTTIEKIDGNVVTVKEVGKDTVLGFAGGQWVEIVDDESTLKGTPHPLVQIDKIDAATSEITMKTSVAGFANLTGLKLRRWDQSGVNVTSSGVSAAFANWIDLEGGIQVQFSAGQYHAGDYWLIPARTATGEIEWPPYQIPNTNPIPQPPRGVRHHYCRLALIEVSGGVASLKADCRERFPALTEICAEDVCFDNTVCKLQGATTVQTALDQLCSAQVTGGGCQITIGERGQIKQLNSESLKKILDEFKGNVCLCFLPGDHVIDDLRLTGEDRSSLSIHGCGHSSFVRVRRPIQLAGFASVEVSSLSINADPACGFVFGKCNEVRFTDIQGEAADARERPFLHFVGIGAILVSGNRIGTKMPGLAVVFEDAQAITHFTENSVEGIVSFYGIPGGPNQAINFGPLAQRLPNVVLQQTSGRLCLSNNHLELLTIGRQKVAEINAVAAAQQNTLTALYAAATLQGNTISAPNNLFVSRFLSLNSCALLSPPGSGQLLGVMVAEGAAAAGNVGMAISDALELVIVARKNIFGEAGNAVFILAP